MDVKVRAATLDDTASMAICHTDAFPGQFMTVMGRTWVSALYAYYINHSKGISIIAVDNQNEVVGLAVGGDNEIRDQFLSVAKKRFVFLLLWKCITKNIVRSKIFGQIFGRKTQESQESKQRKEKEKSFGVLLSIGVKSECAGKGVAGHVMQYFMEAGSERYNMLRLTVHSDNDRAIGFYEKHGWQEVHDDTIEKRFYYQCSDEN